MRGEIWIGWVVLSLLGMGRVEVPGQEAVTGEVRWGNGDVMSGEWLGVEDGWLRFKASELAEPVRVWLPRAVGWVGSRLDEGASVWPCAPKNSFQIDRSPGASMSGRSYRWVRGRPAETRWSAVRAPARASPRDLPPRPPEYRCPDP